MEELREALSELASVMGRIEERLANKTAGYDHDIAAIRSSVDKLEGRMRDAEIGAARLAVKVAMGVAIAGAVLPKLLGLIL